MSLAFPALGIAQAQDSAAKQKLIALGTVSTDHRALINEIKQDLHVAEPVILLIGPFEDKIWMGELFKEAGTAYVAIDQNFYRSLTDKEQEAMIGHEMGHFIYTYIYPYLDDRIKFQLQAGADLFAAQYVGADAVLSWLGKTFPTDDDKELAEYKWRKKVLGDFKQAF